jgi:hypothetical protein
MLAELKEIHEDLLATIAAIEAIVEQSTPDRVNLTSARYKLTRINGRRRKFLAEKVYPRLESLSPAHAQRAAALRNGAASLLAASAQHIARWSVEHIVANWTDYQRASAAIRASMRERIATERAVLYPLLETLDRMERLAG